MEKEPNVEPRGFGWNADYMWARSYCWRNENDAFLWCCSGRPASALAFFAEHYKGWGISHASHHRYCGGGEGELPARPYVVRQDNFLPWNRGWNGTPPAPTHFEAITGHGVQAQLDNNSSPPHLPPTLPTLPPAPRAKRWGDGLEAPAAGTRNFVEHGFEVTLDVSEAIARFGHSSSHVAQIMDKGRAKASTSLTSIASVHAAALFAYTEETPLYGTLNYTMRTPHTANTPTNTELNRFSDYIVHTERALGSLPAHVSERQGNVYRGIKTLLTPDVYAPGKRITWQAFSSSTKKQTATLDFVNVLPGRKLSGSVFVIDSITAKDIRHFSAIPSPTPSSRWSRS